MAPKKDKKVSSDVNNQLPDKAEEKVTAVTGFLKNFTDEFTNLCIESKSSIIPDIVVTDDFKSSKLEIPESTEFPTDENFPSSCWQNYPKMKIICDQTGNNETIQKIMLCKFCMQINLLKAVGSCLEIYSHVSVLMIVDCKLTTNMVKLISEILGKTKTIKELVLDFNPIYEQPYHVLLQSDNKLQILSLRECKINDYGVQLLSNELCYRDFPNTHTLEVLNLTGNHITSKGVQSLANALRTNRTLISLSLAGNNIDDNGAIFIAEILEEFPLSHEEVILSRQRRFKYLLERNSLEERRSKLLIGPEVSHENKKATLAGRKKEKSLHATSSHIQKKLNAQGSKTNSIVTNISRSKLKEVRSSFEDDYSQHDSLKYIEDNHPFVQSVKPKSLALWCTGNLQLNHLNLAYNLITAPGVSGLLKAVKYQDSILNIEQKGVLHMSLHGNPIPHNCFEYSDLVRLINSRYSHFMSDTNQERIGSYSSFKQNSSVNRQSQ